MNFLSEKYLLINCIISGIGAVIIFNFFLDDITLFLYNLIIDNKNIFFLVIGGLTSISIFLLVRRLYEQKDGDE